MNKKKISIHIFILMLFLIGLIGVCGKKQQTEKVEEFKEKWYVTQENTVDHLYIPELKAVITKERYKGGPKTKSISTSYEIAEPRVSTNHIVYDNSKKLVRRPKENPVETIVEVDYYYLNVYSYKDNFSFVKKIDLKKRVNDYNKNYLPYQVYSGIRLVNGKEYISVNIYDKKVKRFGRKSVFVGLEKEDVIENSDDLKVDGYRWDDASSNIIKSGITNLPERLGWSAGGNSLVYYDPPKVESRLKKENARVANILTSESNESIYVSFPDESVPIETIVQALLPEGENMYDNLVLYGKYSKDGKDHKIHSMDEFLEWYQEKK